MLKRTYWSIYLAIFLIALIVGFFFMYLGYDLKNSIVTSTALVSIGTSILASALILALDILKDLFKELYYNKIKNVIIKAGVSQVYEKRDLDEYDRLINNAKTRIYVTGYSLNAFYDSYGDILKTKFKDSNLDIKLILVNPDSEFSTNRAEIERRSEHYFSDSINRILKDDVEHLNIRLINTPLTSMIFCIDDILFVGPHFYGKSSKSTLTMKLSKDGWMFEEYLSEFHRLWAIGTYA